MSAASSWTQRFEEFLAPALPYIVAAWLLGVAALSVYHLGGWTHIRRIRRRLTKQADETLLVTLRDLADRLRIARPIQLFESALVQIPTVVGWIRPVILLPACALTGLTADQLEALLAHELAHVRRYDYLVNIFQTVVEILAFYHPAVWWISSKIRLERENCCDDVDFEDPEGLEDEIKRFNEQMHRPAADNKPDDSEELRSLQSQRKQIADRVKELRRKAVLLQQDVASADLKIRYDVGVQRVVALMSELGGLESRRISLEGRAKALEPCVLCPLNSG